jgi:hypothetical protein
MGCRRQFATCRNCDARHDPQSGLSICEPSRRSCRDDTAGYGQDTDPDLLRARNYGSSISPNPCALGRSAGRSAHGRAHERDTDGRIQSSAPRVHSDVGAGLRGFACAGRLTGSVGTDFDEFASRASGVSPLRSTDISGHRTRPHPDGVSRADRGRSLAHSEGGKSRTKDAGTPILG